MNKVEFLLALTEKLSPMPWSEIEDRWNYYSEMIDDRMEDGLSEEEAVAELGTVEQIAAQMKEAPLNEKKKPARRLGAWEIVLLVLGAPVWIPLLIAALAVILAIYVSVWSVVLSLYAADLAIAFSAVACVIATVVYAIGGRIAAGAFLLGGGLVLAGLAILLFLGCNQIAKGTVWLGKVLLRGFRRGSVK